MFEVGKKSAANEMSVLAPATKAEVKGVMRVQNDALIEQLSASIENAAKSAVTQIASKNAGRVTNTSATDAVDAASAAIDKALEGVATMKTLALSGAVNLGRATIFDRYPEKVYAIQYSAILDQKTSRYVPFAGWESHGALRRALRLQSSGALGVPLHSRRNTAR